MACLTLHSSSGHELPPCFTPESWLRCLAAWGPTSPATTSLRPAPRTLSPTAACLPTPHPLPTSHAATSPGSHSTAVSTEGYLSPRKRCQTVCTHSLLAKVPPGEDPNSQLPEMSARADRSRQGWGHLARGPVRPVTSCGWPHQGNHSKFNQSTAGWFLG